MQDNQHHPDAAAAGNNDEINSEGETVKSMDKMKEMKQSEHAENLALSDEGVALKWLNSTRPVHWMWLCMVVLCQLPPCERHVKASTTGASPAALGQSLAIIITLTITIFIIITILPTFQ